MSIEATDASADTRSNHVVPELVVFGTDVALLKRLRESSPALPYVQYVAGFGPDVTAQARLDALWVSLMAAVELFAAAPPFPTHEAQVLPTPPARVEMGFPRYGIVGVAVSENDPKTPEFGLRLVASSLLRAVHTFNAHNEDQIARVGILPEDLALNQIRPEEALRILREVFDARVV